MKILYYNNQLALHGGTERVTALKINELVNRGYEVCLLTYEQNGRPFIYPISNKVKYCDLCINYNVTNVDESPYTFGRLMKVPKHIWKTYKYIRKEKPDIVIVPYSLYEFWFVPFIKGRSKIIKEYHDSQFLKPLIKWPDKHIIIEKIDEAIQRLYNRVVVLTPEERKYFKYVDNIEVIPNPLEQSNLKSLQNNKTIITVGRMSPVKQFDKFVEMAEVVHKTYPDWIFKIYGGGHSAFVEPLRRLIIEKGLEDVVFMMGETNEVHKVLSESSVYVCTSANESFGLTLVEALDAALPVVSFDCPNGPRNIIQDGEDGFLVPNGDVTMLSSKVMQLISDDSLRMQMSKNAIKNVKRFRTDNVMKIWCELFDTLLNERK